MECQSGNMRLASAAAGLLFMLDHDEEPRPLRRTLRVWWAF